MSEWPSDDQLIVGDFVCNVHPMNRGYPMNEGIVTGVEVDLDSVMVRTGKGSTVYGPRKNWRLMDRRPAWMKG